MKKSLLGILALVSVLSTTSFSSENKVGIGLGVGTSTKIYKKEDREYLPIPSMDVQYGPMYIKGMNIGVDLIKDDAFAVSLFVDPYTGFGAKGKDMKNGYKNIDERKYQTMVGAKIDANTGINDIRTMLALKTGEHGTVGKASIYKAFRVNDKLTLIPNIGMSGYSGDYSDYYFGVSSGEANRSKFDKLTEYKANEAYSFDAGLLADYRLTDDIALTSFLGVNKFSDEIGDSPIVENDVVYMVSVGARYYF